MKAIELSVSAHLEADNESIDATNSAEPQGGES